LMAGISYFAVSMTGRCANGAQRDQGHLVHAVRKVCEHSPSWDKALCLAKPGHRRGNGWGEPLPGGLEMISCPRCRKRLTIA
jgi:hypothetical protein